MNFMALLRNSIKNIHLVIHLWLRRLFSLLILTVNRTAHNFSCLSYNGLKKKLLCFYHSLAQNDWKNEGHKEEHLPYYRFLNLPKNRLRTLVRKKD
jgi:hypothetical protein